jgi:hypothetical protein
MTDSQLWVYIPGMNFQALFLDRYELVLTEDQSPTFRDLSSDSKETMHHRGGAYSETQLIYGDALRACLQAGGRNILSVGLGLGYNEILVAVESLRHSLSPREIRLLSFESEEPLRTAFVNWLQGEPNEVYENIAGFFSFDIFKIKHWLLQARENRHWDLEHSLGEDVFHNIAFQADCVFYDAFSSKTSPGLWSEDFLNQFFKNFCGDRSAVSTYACTGALKRALKAQGFELLLKPGFNGKRLRTMGIRGWENELKFLFSNP